MESLVPELSPSAVVLPFPQPLPQTPPQASPATSASPTTLPPLEAHDERFLSYASTLAGRAVVVELMSRPDDDRRTRESLWKTYGTNNELQELGLAAQALERARFNWRAAKSPTKVLEAFRALPQGTTN